MRPRQSDTFSDLAYLAQLVQEIGEKYLRLYGLLSATYIQQEAVLTIYRLMNVTDPAEAKKRFEALQIRSLRHKIAAHGTSYNNPRGGKEAHVVIRIELGDWEVASINKRLLRLMSGLMLITLLMVCVSSVCAIYFWTCRGSVSTGSTASAIA